MLIGELDRRISLEYPTFAVTDYGDVAVDGWTEWREVWAKIEWNGGSETDETDKITAITKVNFFIRNLDLMYFISGTAAGDDNPTMSWRIAYTDGGLKKHYHIHNIEQIEGRDALMKIITKEKD